MNESQILRYPMLYQINTRVWITELSEKLSKQATLDDIPDRDLDRIADMGFDWIWMLSVWSTGDAGREVSRSCPEWQKEFRETLPNLHNSDIAGSGFAITSYSVHQNLGGDAALRRFRTRLRRRGIRLMLDFVPNHTGLDHPWVEEHPEYYISGSKSDIEQKPENYTRVKRKKGDLILAYGRDPYFSGWPDTLQLNYGNPDLQETMQRELTKISAQCDGLRCDMAMLIIPEVFQNTWRISIQPFWQKAIKYVKEKFPEFCFMAEVYWDMEWELQQQGFDYTYDKKLYDTLRNCNAGNVRAHLKAGLDYQSKMARFMENHDEQRAVAVFSQEIYKAAAVITYLTPGMRFFHQGQLQGKKKKISPHLIRGAAEHPNKEIEDFYCSLMLLLKQEIFHKGHWELLECLPAWEGNWTCNCFVLFAWHDLEDELILIAVNYAANQSQCYARLPFSNLAEKNWKLQDCLSKDIYERNGYDLLSRGLFLDMPAWKASLFSFKKLIN